MDENLNNNNELNKDTLEQVVGGKGKNKECNPHDYIKLTWFTDSRIPEAPVYALYQCRKCAATRITKNDVDTNMTKKEFTDLLSYFENEDNWR